MIRYVLSTYSIACHAYVAHAHIETEPLLNARRIKRRHFNFYEAFVFEFFYPPRSEIVPARQWH